MLQGRTCIVIAMLTAVSASRLVLAATDNATAGEPPPSEDDNRDSLVLLDSTSTSTTPSSSSTSRSNISDTSNVTSTVQPLAASPVFQLEEPSPVTQSLTTDEQRAPTSPTADKVLSITVPPPQEIGQLRRAFDHVISHVLYAHRLGRKSVCYDSVGCFHVSGKFSHLRSVPDSPERLHTRFALHTRSAASSGEDEGQALDPAHQESVAFSSFDPQRPTKVLVHGYNGHGYGLQMKRILIALLKKEDANVVVVDWSQGAKGPNYLRAIANAELVARQLSQLVIHMVTLGASVKDVHMIGFSLGAQVAGLAGEALGRRGEKLGRITGLDPASFLFERAGLEAKRRLDISDAEFVDVIHTDGSLMWSDGFGLLGPVGHVDFFPNGGQDQPGCDDSYIGALKFQITRNGNGSGVCSHARSVDLFIESLEPSCSFVGFPCPGLKSFSRDFKHGSCFSCDGGSCGTMGLSAAESLGRGPLYFVTRPTKPYCGQQLRAAVSVSPYSRLVRGSFVLQLQHGSSSTSFELSSTRLSAQAIDVIAGGQEISSLAVAKVGSLSLTKTPHLKAALTFRPRPGPARFTPHRLVLDRVTVTTQEGDWWYYCSVNTTLDYSRWQHNQPLEIELSTHHC